MTTDNLTAELLIAVQKNLPQHVGETLTKELAELTRLRGAEPQWLATKTSLDARITNLSHEFNRVTEDLKKHEALEAREKAVMHREMRADLNDLKVELHKEMRADLKEIFVSVFRSPTVTRTFNGTVPVAVEGVAPGLNNQYGSPGMVVQSPVNTVEKIQES